MSVRARNTLGKHGVIDGFVGSCNVYAQLVFQLPFQRSLEATMVKKTRLKSLGEDLFFQRGPSRGFSVSVTGSP